MIDYVNYYIFLNGQQAIISMVGKYPVITLCGSTCFKVISSMIDNLNHASKPEFFFLPIEGLKLTQAEGQKIKLAA